jgi:hypothetical protein
LAGSLLILRAEWGRGRAESGVEGAGDSGGEVADNEADSGEKAADNEK